MTQFTNAIKGQALVEYRRDCIARGLKNSEIVRGAGYVSQRNDGSERLNFTAFYQELLYAKGTIQKVRVTVTDTFGGQPNFSWADRYEIFIYNTNPVREVKAEIGLTGVKCDRREWGCDIHLRPRGMNQIVMIQYV
jgi:hypothetical protein